MYTIYTTETESLQHLKLQLPSDATSLDTGDSHWGLLLVWYRIDLVLSTLVVQSVWYMTY
jgi:hypothetical protein